MAVSDWFLSASERGNSATTIDSRHVGGLAWTGGNVVRPLVHGKEYFPALLAALRGTRAGDVVMFTDWRGDPDERLDGPGTEISEVLSKAAGDGVVIKGLVWRSHANKLQFSAEENRRLVDAIQAAGGDCLLDMRVKLGGSHHQKLFVIRHPDRPELDVAYVGGIDLCHARNDGPEHAGDPQAAPMAPAYGSRPPWHDVQLEIRGPAVADVETVFRERWNDPAALSRYPWHWLRDLVERRRAAPDKLPRRIPDLPVEPAVATVDGEAAICGQAVQVLRTYPRRRGGGYPFAPRGERSIARGYMKALSQAHRLIYVEDQYLWSAEVLRPFAEALRHNPGLHLIVVLPSYPDSPHRSVAAAQSYGRRQALAVLQEAGGDRVACYGLENSEGTPIYVHAKVCVVDDTWATVGSDNFNLRSWTFDSELTCAVYDDTAGKGLPRQLRLRLNREHLERADGDDADLCDPMTTFATFAAAADALDRWHAEGCRGPRPAGRLRHYRPAPQPWENHLVARLLYKFVCDPDGRPTKMQVRHSF